MINTSGGVSNGNLSTTGPLSRTVFTAGLVGSGQIEASFSGLAKTPSGAITVQPGPATRLRITGANAAPRAGEAHQIDVTALDVAGNIATSYAGPKTLRFSGANPSTRPVTPPTISQGATNVPFGQDVNVSFTAGKMVTTTVPATGRMTLYRDETVTIHVLDVNANIGSAGADGFNVNVAPSDRFKLSIYRKGAEGQPAVTEIITAGVPISLTIRAEDAFGNVVAGYPSNTGPQREYRFTGAANAPDGTPPSVIDDDGAIRLINTQNVDLDFVDSVATATNGRNGVMTLFNAGSYTIHITQQNGAENGFSSTNGGGLSVQVLPSPNQTFAWVLHSPQTNGQVFTGINSLTVQDIYSNTITNYDAALNPVTITAGGGLSGTVSFASPHGDNVLDLSSDFAGGVADLGALGMTYLGQSGSGTLTAVAGSRTATSSPVIINPGPPASLQIQAKTPLTTSSATVSAGSPVTLTLTLFDQSGNVATGYDSSASLTFTGVPNPPPNGQPAPVVTDSGGVSQPFGQPTSLSFVDGRSQVSGNANGRMTIFQASGPSPYSIEATAQLNLPGAPTIGTAPGKELLVTVNPGEVAQARIAGPTNAPWQTYTQFTIEALDAFNNPTSVAVDTQFTLSSDRTGMFALDEGGTIQTTTFTILAGSGSVRFYYRPEELGNHVLSGTASVPVTTWTVAVP
ncbi:MAG TPA: hypothetical protein VNK95_00450, partial [Caldilineaceae bacterium]|nr:hypothetical protein [Caldilineaceae bacterium]